jgi:mannose-6-phosphate isomerase-like protein (cupin superfamily)
LNHVTDYREHLGSREGKHFKATLFQGDHLMLGINCLDPGQVQSVHTHAGQDKFYAVQEGSGEFTVAEQRFTAGPGTIVWAPAGVEHGVENTGAERLVLLVGIAPPPR